MLNANAIYVSSKDMIFLIGAFDRYGANKYLGIWRYYMKSNKWERMNSLKFELYDSNFTVTAGEEYVVLAGVYHNSNAADKKNMIVT